jgi:hypothetical protein
MSTPLSRAAQSREATLKRANGYFQVWEDRTQLVKQEMEAQRTAIDAKTARLRTLRLAKEAQDAEAARIKAANAPTKPSRKR